jgi:hypothetical protein
VTTLVQSFGGDGIGDYPGRKLQGGDVGRRRRRGRRGCHHWTKLAAATSLVGGGVGARRLRRRWRWSEPALLLGDDVEGGADVGRSRCFGVEVVSLLEPESARSNVCGDPCVGRRPSPWRRGTRLK